MKLIHKDASGLQDLDNPDGHFKRYNTNGNDCLYLHCTIPSESYTMFVSEMVQLFAVVFR
jgi:hypothetical protein